MRRFLSPLRGTFRHQTSPGKLQNDNDGGESSFGASSDENEGDRSYDGSSLASSLQRRLSLSSSDSELLGSGHGAVIDGSQCCPPLPPLVENGEAGCLEARTPRPPSNCPAELPVGKVSDQDLQEAALWGDEALVRYLICAGSSVNAPMRVDSPDGDVFMTLLHVLSSRPELPNGKEVLSELVRQKANINARSSIGSTPLSRACLHKHVDAAQLLLHCGADTKPIDDRGRNAARCAIELVEGAASSNETLETLSGQLVALLAKSGADLDNGGEVSPLLEAIKRSNRPAVAALCEHGARPGWLHCAVEEASTDIVKLLLESMANPFEEDGEGRSATDVAIQRGDEEITTLLRNFIGDLHRRCEVSLQNGRSVILRKTEEPRMEEVTRAVSFEGGVLGLSPEAKAEHHTRAGGSLRHSKRISLTRIHLLATHKHIYQEAAKTSVQSLQRHFPGIQALCRRLNANRWFQFIMFSALLMALFLPDLWTIADVKHNGDLDIIICFVLFMFLAEVVIQSIGMPHQYINSFFFWMDILGAMSVPLDHSAIAESLPTGLDNAVVMRAAKMARLGARAGRFTKLVKILRFLPGIQRTAGNDESMGTAKAMSSALMQSLSTRVSCLILVMVLVLPLFDLPTYPENDFSMRTWLDSLEHTLLHPLMDMELYIYDIETFYESMDYYPFELVWLPANATAAVHRRLKGSAPRRKRNRHEVSSNAGTVRALFNFGPQNRAEAIGNIVLICTIMAIMIGFSMLLSSSVSAVALRPLEHLLQGVNEMATKIFECVKIMTDRLQTEEQGGPASDLSQYIPGHAQETDLLATVIEKLTSLSSVKIRSRGEDTLQQLCQGEREVIQVYAQSAEPVHPHATEQNDVLSSVSGEGESDSGEDYDRLVAMIERHLEEAGVQWGVLDSWHFDALDLLEKQQYMVCLCFLVFHGGMNFASDQQVLLGFLEEVSSRYSSPQKVPYHNWYHAVDVTHCVFQLLHTCEAESFLSKHEMYALIVSAASHDIGHPGLNNPYLVEMAHELAMRYNDLSPLENMHCATLFEITKQPQLAVFRSMSKTEYRETRVVCIEAILHTDNAHHFSMMKELQMMYEMNSDILGIALQMFQEHRFFPAKEVVELFGETDKRKLLSNFFLHFSDISNPTKPFKICSTWAWLILDELFQQGDSEKELGIAVQPLNDREKVNKPHSQVGFIEFFIAPFAFAAMRLLPPLHRSTAQLMHNLNSWSDAWIADAAPDAEELAKMQDRIAKIEARFVASSGRQRYVSETAPSSP